MANLKMKINYRGCSVEFEGDEETVISELDKIKSGGLGTFSQQVDYLENSNSITPLLVSEKIGHDSPRTISTGLSGLKEVVFKDKGYKEYQWVLIYSLYLNKGGKDFFSRQDIISKYEESKRKEGTNLTNNIKKNVDLEFLKITNEDEYFLTEEGLTEARKYIENPGNYSQGKKPSSDKNTNKGKTIKKNTSQSRWNLLDDLNIMPTGKDSLIDFLDKFGKTNKNEQITIIVHYLKKILGIESVNIDHVATCLHSIKENVPSRLDVVIRRIKSDDNLLKMSGMKDIELSAQGINYINLNSNA